MLVCAKLWLRCAARVLPCIFFLAAFADLCHLDLMCSQCRSDMTFCCTYCLQVLLDRVNVRMLKIVVRLQA